MMLCSSRCNCENISALAYIFKHRLSNDALHPWLDLRLNLVKVAQNRSVDRAAVVLMMLDERCTESREQERTSLVDNADKRRDRLARSHSLQLVLGSLQGTVDVSVKLLGHSHRDARFQRRERAWSLAQAPVESTSAPL